MRCLSNIISTIEVGFLSNSGNLPKLNMYAALLCAIELETGKHCMPRKNSTIFLVMLHFSDCKPCLYGFHLNSSHPIIQYPRPPSLKANETQPIQRLS